MVEWSLWFLLGQCRRKMICCFAGATHMRLHAQSSSHSLYTHTQSIQATEHAAEEQSTEHNEYV